MFERLFRRKPGPADDLWTVATADDNGHPLVISYRSAPPRGVSPADYPHLIAVHGSYEPPNEGGMPTPEEKARMDSLESLLIPALEAPRVAFNTVVVTGNSVREWQWYSRDPEETMRLVNSAPAGQPPFPVSFAVQHDPTWSAYSRFHGSAT